MYVKSALKEVTLRSDGTFALGVDVAVLFPPQAARTTPTTAREGNNRASFMRTPHKCKIVPAAFFPFPGARVRRQRVHSVDFEPGWHFVAHCELMSSRATFQRRPRPIIEP